MCGNVNPSWQQWHCHGAAAGLLLGGNGTDSCSPAPSLDMPKRECEVRAAPNSHKRGWNGIDGDEMPIPVDNRQKEQHAANAAAKACKGDS